MCSWSYIWVWEWIGNIKELSLSLSVIPLLHTPFDLKPDMAFRCGCGHTHMEYLHANTCSSTNKNVHTHRHTHSVWLTDKLFEGTHVHAHSNMCKNTPLSRKGFYFVYFLLAKHQKANSISHHTDKQQYYNPRCSTMPFLNAPPLTTCGMGWRKGGFKQTDMNTQQIPPTANKICMAEDDYL